MTTASTDAPPGRVRAVVVERAVGEQLAQRVPGLQREGGLAGTREPGHRDEDRLGGETGGRAGDHGELGTPADEAVRTARQGAGDRQWQRRGGGVRRVPGVRRDPRQHEALGLDQPARGAHAQLVVEEGAGLLVHLECPALLPRGSERAHEQCDEPLVVRVPGAQRVEAGDEPVQRSRPQRRLVALLEDAEPLLDETDALHLDRGGLRCALERWAGEDGQRAVVLVEGGPRVLDPPAPGHGDLSPPRRRVDLHRVAEPVSPTLGDDDVVGADLAPDARDEGLHPVARRRGRPVAPEPLPEPVAADVAVQGGQGQESVLEHAEPHRVAAGGRQADPAEDLQLHQDRSLPHDDTRDPRQPGRVPQHERPGSTPRLWARVRGSTSSQIVSPERTP